MNPGSSPLPSSFSEVGGVAPTGVSAADAVVLQPRRYRKLDVAVPLLRVLLWFVSIDARKPFGGPWIDCNSPWLWEEEEEKEEENSQCKSTASYFAAPWSFTPACARASCWRTWLIRGIQPVLVSRLTMSSHPGLSASGS